MVNVKTNALSFWLGLSLLACNSNVYEPIENPNPADQAAAYMDEQKPDEAISVLDKALSGDSQNYQLISMLASAKAQKAGVDTFDLIIRLASEGVSGGNGLTAMFSILPAVTVENRRLMLEVVNLLASIPAASRTDADNLKATIFNASFTALQAKFFDADGDGSFTIDELANLDDESADAIINSLLDAQNSAVLFQGAEENGVAAEKVEAIKAELDAQPGATNAEKLRNLLAASGQLPNNIPSTP
ncbi:MAG: hypothetical protein EOP10_16060 [Proteobacteria bacterium]|nr:MAG: hypothetical protein EOP10_16060 [Pseudomonadota bacterium]